MGRDKQPQLRLGKGNVRGLKNIIYPTQKIRQYPNLVKQITKQVNELLRNPKNKDLLIALDKMVYCLFELSAAEIALVEEVMLTL